MIFIIGGRGQGQNEYARKCLSKMCGTQDGMHDKVRDEDKMHDEMYNKEKTEKKRTMDTDSVRTKMRIADGETDAPESALEADLVLNLHLFVKKVMEMGKNPREFVTELLRAAPEIITMDEIGCGIVPIDAFERNYRDEAGMAGQMTALQAESVIRMICGIPQKIR